jgi:uncharacterized damage-inducible protein DinB
MQQKRNAVLALLAEYEKAIHELQATIEDITADDLISFRDEVTSNLDYQSIQTILSHVLSSGYSYCIYIQNLKDSKARRPEKKFRSSIYEYKNDLDILIDFTKNTFASIYDAEIEEFDNSKKMMTSWGQLYDIEQLMEHAIVHVLRHRRQIEQYKK